MPRQEPIFESIAVAYYVNTNPRPERICPYCRGLLQYLRAVPGSHNGVSALVATQAVLVGQDIFYKLSPKQHVKCWCDWKYAVIPATEIVNVLTDDDVSYDTIFRNLSGGAKKAAGEHKTPYWYREELRRKRRDRKLLAGAFGVGALIGLIGAGFKDEEYRGAKKRIRELRRKDKKDNEIVKVIMEEYPNKSGLKALRTFGYI